MNPYTLKRFASTQTLRSISLSNLREFLSPYSAYLVARGFSIALTDERMFPDDFRTLVSILGHPDAETPQRLIDALYHVNEMSTPSGMAALIAEFENAGYRFGEDEPAPADFAVFAWITDSDLFEQVCAKQRQLSWRTFRVYAPEAMSAAESAFDANGLPSLERALNDWSEEHSLGRHCKIFQIPHDGERCYVIRRGQPYSRVSAIARGKSASIVFQPETFDIVICSLLDDELHISAGANEARDLYRRLFGEHMFGDARHFSDQPVYTLGPIAAKGRDSLFCDDIPGITDVKLRRVEMNTGGGLSQSTTWKGADVYLNQDFVRHVSADSDFAMALITIKYEGPGRPRSAEVRPPNVLRYRRDGDLQPLGHLLRSRGFVIRANYGRHS